MEERQPFAATNKSPCISTTSLVYRTLAFTMTEPLSYRRWKERKRWPHNNIFDGRALYRRPWRSAQCAALKFKLSSLVNVLWTFLSLSVTQFYSGKKENHNGIFFYSAYKIK